MLLVMYLPSHLTLQPGDNGDFVAEMQRRLVGQKLLSEGNVSGYYDGITTSAVRAFQALNGLEADGIAGPETLRLLNAAAGFFSNTEGSEASGAGSGSTEEDKIAENGDKFDDFVVTQKAYEHQQQQIEGIYSDLQRQQDYNTLNELRARGHGHGEQPLWGKDHALAPDKMQAIQDGVRAQQVDQMLQDKGTQNPLRDQDQLQVNREGVQAKTLGDSLREDPARATEAQQREALQRDGQPRDGQPRDGTQRDGPQRDDLQARQQIGQQPQAGQQLGPDGRPLSGPQMGQMQHPALGLNQQQGFGIQMQSQTQLTPPNHNRQLSPDLQRTHNRLDHGSRIDAQTTGQQLDDRGVQNLGNVPMQQLGQLHPSSTPNVGIGGPARGM